MPKLSFVTTAYNEEAKLAGCLESVKDLADEIIVIDNCSTDRTAAIAKKYKAKIYSRPNLLMLNTNKNFGFSKAKGKWILNLDPDEHITAELKEEIKQVIGRSKEDWLPPAGNDKEEIVGYWIARKNIIFGKWIQNDMWWPDYQLRLFQKGKAHFPEKHVHEYMTIHGQTAKLTQPMIHENYDSIGQFLHKLDKIYTENEAQNILSQGKVLAWTDALKMPISDFLKTFFSQKGYKDGLHGLVLSILQAFYAEVVFVKVWEKQGFREYYSPQFLQEVYKLCRKIGYEFQYWFLTSFITQSKKKFERLLYKIERKALQKKIT